jgi:chaperonin GroEL (HSP60 family)
VKALGFGDRRKAMLADLAVLTDTVVVSEEIGLSLKELTTASLGKVKRVEIDKDNTTIIGGTGNKESIKERCAEIRVELERTKSDYDREKLYEPLRQIGRNAELDEGLVVERTMNGEGAYGLDASRNEYVDLREAGIIDPTKVLRVALENAVSVVGTLLLASTTLIEVEEEQPPSPESGMPPQGGWG